MLLSSMLLTALLVATSVTAADVPCPSGCSCSSIGKTANCFMKGITTVPPGYFKDIQELDVSSNNIEALGLYDLTGFPNLRKLKISSNPLTQIDLNIFTSIIYFGNLYAVSCKIQNVVPLDSGKELINLKSLSLSFNEITSLPHNFITGITRLEELSLGYNPLILPSDHSLIESNTLQLLDIKGVDGSKISSETFKGLPKLHTLYLANSNISDIYDSMSFLPSLTNLYIESNPIQILRRGSFTKQQNLKRVDFSKSELESLEAAVFDGAVIGSLTISDTPLVCECKHEALFWWSVARNVTLYANCRFQDVCQFGTKKNRDHFDFMMW